jgi:hypothetical protein
LNQRFCIAPTLFKVQKGAVARKMGENRIGGGVRTENYLRLFLNARDAEPPVQIMLLAKVGTTGAYSNFV